MIRTQIQLTEEQFRKLKKMAVKKNKSMAALIRMSVDSILQKEGIAGEDQIRLRAIQAAGKLSGSADLSSNHDEYLAEVYNK